MQSCITIRFPPLKKRGIKPTTYKYSAVDFPELPFFYFNADKILRMDGLSLYPKTETSHKEGVYELFFYFSESIFANSKGCVRGVYRIAKDTLFLSQSVPISSNTEFQPYFEFPYDCEEGSEYLNSSAYHYYYTLVCFELKASAFLLKKRTTLAYYYSEQTYPSTSEDLILSPLTPNSQLATIPKINTDSLLKTTYQNGNKLFVKKRKGFVDFLNFQPILSMNLNGLTLSDFYTRQITNQNRKRYKETCPVITNQQIYDFLLKYTKAP